MSATEFFLGPIGTTLLIGISTLVLLIWYSSIKHSYWKKKGIPQVKPLPLLGTVLDSFITQFHETELKRYREHGHIYGHYEGSTPLLSVGDPKILRNIFVKDFPFFANHRAFAVGDRIIDNILTILEGEDWKRVRAIITPTFSTGKLKRMLSIFKDCAKTLVQNFQIAAQKEEPVNAKELYGALAMDVITSSAFSTKIDSHNNPNNKVVQMSKQIFSSIISWRSILFLICPSFMRFFRIAIFRPDISKFFTDLTLQIIEERKRSGQTRNDFLQLLLDTAKDVAAEENREDTNKENDLVINYDHEIASQKVFQVGSKKNLSKDELVAQCVTFFIAGYDTTASTLSFASYSLALNEDIQNLAFQEITECLNETNGELTYEALQKMKYLDNIISETLRLYPPAFRVERRVEADYKLGDTDIIVPKDMIITIPIYGIHKDSKYFPNPEKFDPNRFTAEERAKRDPYTYLPFGAGPRNCVGMRFALMEIKMCLVHVISCFNIKTCAQTQIPIQFKSGAGLLQPKEILLKMEPRENIPLVI